ncbi:MAG: DUF3175 domain-containing protein [Chloroflexi bacterium]|nr:MAG: DUF3175 domain-containing protein [Chloroflexota bacterium]
MGSRTSKAPKQKRWSQRVTEQSNALDLEPSVFTRKDPRAGKSLSRQRLEKLEKAKDELRKLYGKTGVGS